MKLYCEYTAREKDKTLKLIPSLIEIKGSQISSVQDWKKSVQELPANTLKLEGKMLTPSFINPHSHLAMSFFRYRDLQESARGNMVKDYYFQVEKKLTAEDVRAFTRMGAYECLFFGVGQVWDHYYHGYAIAEALYDVGLSGVIAPTLQDLEGPGKERWEQEWAHTEAIHGSKKFAEQSIFAALGPHATDTVSSDLWTRIQKEATTKKLPIHLHLAQSREEFHKRLGSENLTPTQFLSRLHLFDTGTSMLLAHGIYLRDSCLKQLASHSNLHLIFCPFSQMIFDYPANIMEWEKHKIPWLIATDTVASNDSMNLQKELRFVSGFPLLELTFSSDYQNFTHKHLSLEALEQKRAYLWKTSERFRDPSFLLRKLWSQAGQLHPQFQVGCIQENNLANLIVWDLDHPTFWPGKNLRSLCFSDSSAAIYNMMLGGRWIGEDGNYAQSIRFSPGYAEALKEAKERLKFLSQSI